MEFSSSALPVPLASALSEQFEPARLSSLLPASSSSSPPPLCLFQFPAKFDIVAFASLGLQLPARARGQEEEEEEGEERALRHQEFSLHGVRYALLEADVADVSELISLLPAASSSSSSRHRGRLLPGRPLTRLFRVIGVVQPSESDWTAASSLSSSSSSALLRTRPRQSAVMSSEAGRQQPVWRPIGFIADRSDPHHTQHRKQQQQVQQQPAVTAGLRKDKKKKRRRQEQGAEQDEKQPQPQLHTRPQQPMSRSPPQPQHEQQQSESKKRRKSHSKHSVPSERESGRQSE